MNAARCPLFVIALAPADIGRAFAAGSGSINRRGLARGAIFPWLGGKRANARRRDAGILVATCFRRHAAIGVLHPVLRPSVAFTSQSGCCKHGCSDQPSRQKLQFVQSSSPWISANDDWRLIVMRCACLGCCVHPYSIWLSQLKSGLRESGIAMRNVPTVMRVSRQDHSFSLTGPASLRSA